MSNIGDGVERSCDWAWRSGREAPGRGQLVTNDQVGAELAVKMPIATGKHNSRKEGGNTAQTVAHGFNRVTCD